MERVFLHFLNASLAAVPLVLAVLAARWLLRRAPRWVLCLLWAVVAVRLLCPQLPSSPVGLAPAEPAAGSVWVVEAVLPAATVRPGNPAPVAAVEMEPNSLGIAAGIWAMGAAGMLLYLGISCLRLRRKVAEAVPEGEGVWLCDGLPTPFILGLVRPRIYLPSDLMGPEKELVLAHERSHLGRRDHWWKPLGFALLAAAWFNPVMWLAYSFLCRDIELACDEKVASRLDLRGKKAYSQALLDWSGHARLVYACPLAFGEVAVKDRVKKVLQYKKPGFWIFLLALIAVAAAAVCFLTTQEETPPPHQELPVGTDEVGRDLERLKQEEEALMQEIERLEQEREARLQVEETGVASDWTGSFAHGFKQSDAVYTGGMVQLPYEVRATGGTAKQETGVLLLLDGQPQPYRLSEHGELKYMHTFTGSAEAAFWFTPVTGKAGQTLELTAFSIREPDYRNQGELVPFAVSSGSIPVQTRLIFQADASRETPSEKERILSQEISHRDSSHAHPPEMEFETNLQELPEEDRLKVLVTAGGPPEAMWTVTVYVNHIPAARESLCFQTWNHQVAELACTLDMSGLSQDSVVYAVLACRNWREAGDAVSSARISKTYYLSPQ